MFYQTNYLLEIMSTLSEWLYAHPELADRLELIRLADFSSPSESPKDFYSIEYSVEYLGDCFPYLRGIIQIKQADLENSAGPRVFIWEHLDEYFHKLEEL